MKKSVNILLLFIICGCSNDSGSPKPTTDVGQGGSLARFTISNDHLYAVDSRRLITFSLQDAMTPIKVDEFNLDWGVETIFAMDTLIFIGTQTGMHIFDISDSDRPGYLSGFEHMQACDPVVAQDTLAFVTLRSGNRCQNGLNQLDVLDIRNVKEPVLIKSYEMKNPHGLAVSGNFLFVCEGDFGMKVFEIKSHGQVELIKFYHNIRSTDVIIGDDNHLIVMANDGLFQYDYSDVQNITKVSEIRIEL